MGVCERYALSWRTARDTAVRKIHVPQPAVRPGGSGDAWRGGLFKTLPNFDVLATFSRARTRARRSDAPVRSEGIWRRAVPCPLVPVGSEGMYRAELCKGLLGGGSAVRRTPPLPLPRWPLGAGSWSPEAGCTAWGTGSTLHRTRLSQDRPVAGAPAGWSRPAGGALGRAPTTDGAGGGARGSSPWLGRGRGQGRKRPCTPGQGHTCTAVP